MENNLNIPGFPGGSAIKNITGFSGGSAIKSPPANAGDMVQSLGWEDTLEKEMATYSSILACEIPWTGEPGGLPVHGVTKEFDTT